MTRIQRLSRGLNILICYDGAELWQVHDTINIYIIEDLSMDDYRELISLGWTCNIPCKFWQFL